MIQTSSRYKRITKTAARKLFNEGKEVIIVGNNVNDFHFFSGWNLAHTFKKDEDHQDFDSYVNSFEFYLEPELGKYAAFFIKPN